MKSAKTVHIERLVLHGFRSLDRAQIAEALRLELRHLVAENTPTDSARVHGLDGGEIPVRAGDPVEAIGTQAARRLHQSLGVAAGSGAARVARGGRSRGGGT